MAKAKAVPTPVEIRNRLRDEVHGVRPGVNLNPAGLEKKDETPLPELKDLGLPLSMRKRLELLVTSHAEYGHVEREASKSKEICTAQIKAIIGEELAETPKFFCQSMRVTYFPMERKSLSQDTLRRILMDYGVKRDVVDAAIEGATTISTTMALKISAAKEE